MKIGEYTTTGTTVNASLITGLLHPLSIAVSGGDIFVLNGNGTIGEYTTSGADGERVADQRFECRSSRYRGDPRTFFHRPAGHRRY